MPKRILIVEDEAVVRRAIRVFLEHHHFEVCGEAVNDVEVLEKAAALHPDLIPSGLTKLLSCIESILDDAPDSPDIRPGTRQ
jgi:DNA-binding NarL/FixJ family response regulator